jgi:hypothetical protein
VLSPWTLGCRGYHYQLRAETTTARLKSPAVALVFIASTQMSEKCIVVVVLATEDYQPSAMRILATFRRWSTKNQLFRKPEKNPKNWLNPIALYIR